MSLNLTDEERKYLYETLNRQSVWWIRDSILAKVLDDDQNHFERDRCEHEWTNFESKEIACAKCGKIGRFARTVGKKADFEITKREVPADLFSSPNG